VIEQAEGLFEDCPLCYGGLGRCGRCHNLTGGVPVCWRIIHSAARWELPGFAGLLRQTTQGLGNRLLESIGACHDAPIHTCLHPGVRASGFRTVQELSRGALNPPNAHEVWVFVVLFVATSVAHTVKVISCQRCEPLRRWSGPLALGLQVVRGHRPAVAPRR